MAKLNELIVCGDGCVAMDMLKYHIHQGILKKLHFRGIFMELLNLLWTRIVYLCGSFKEQH